MESEVIIILAIGFVGAVLFGAYSRARSKALKSAPSSQLPQGSKEALPDRQIGADEVDRDSKKSTDVESPTLSEKSVVPSEDNGSSSSSSRSIIWTESSDGERSPTFVPPPLPSKSGTFESRGSDLDPSSPGSQPGLIAGLSKTRKGFIAKLDRLIRGQPKVDRALKEEIEEILYTSDIGTKTAEKLLQQVSEVLDRGSMTNPDAVWSVIHDSCLQILNVPAPPPDYSPDPAPYVLLMIGVNGVGKTTTLGKLAAMHQQAGRKVLLVAGDTFRAAATEQLQIWATRIGCSIHSAPAGSDPSSVLYDGISRGREEGFDVVLCDTAGRLHTRKELMDELQKVARSCSKALSRDRSEILGCHDVYLVLDATIGQNALAQAALFKETMNFSGLVITKLDGTAKGGVVLGICDQMGIPIRHIGIGEKVEDLRPFDPQEFTNALLAPENDANEATKKSAG